ncbi:hypothetical protein [Nocardioides jensenii]|uniref:hypothetical protein n=1 Tax=Nocardioides jensenii TaxID=1843 RepID=UPI00082A10E7|nr:hypothetical protein [Nocardioides jensenii]
MNSTLTGLALVERLLMEDGEGVQDIARTTPPDELGELVSVLATLLAAQMHGQYGNVGALEKITDWRHLYVMGKADA